MTEENPAKGLSVGIIMDGNGRWAKKRGLPRTAGHQKGADVFDATVRHADKIGVAAITFYAFSTENWARPKAEVDMIMQLFHQSLKKLLKYNKEDKRVYFIGERSVLKPNLRAMMDDIEAETTQNSGMIINLAINYGGRQEIVRAARLLAGAAVRGEVDAAAISEADVEKHLYTHGQPEPHFILRTSGEQRLSNFMLWQSAYSEMVFTNVLWPDFTNEDFDDAVREYHSRSRRFGGV